MFLDWNLKKSEFNIAESMMLVANKKVEKIENNEEFLKIFFKLDKCYN